MPTIICDDYKIEITKTQKIINTPQIKRQKTLTRKEKYDQKIQQYNERRELKIETLKEKIRVTRVRIKELKNILEKEKQIQKEIENEKISL